MPAGLDELRALLPAARVEVLGELGGSTRSSVHRVRADSRTVIVKEFTNSPDGWVRECAALSVLPPDAPTPRLIAAGAAPPTVVMSDVGSGPSVADALLGDDPARAADAVVAWARSMASLHRVTTGSRPAFRNALAAYAGDRTVEESTVSTGLDAAARTIDQHGTELGIDVAAAALRELRGLSTRLGSAGPAALTPADACPDNNVFRDDTLILIDFEGAQWRHLAWDIAYLSVPWPSCWCSWRLPEEISERAIDAYRAALALPYADSPLFRADVAAAAVGWAFVSASWFLPAALRDDPPLTGSARPGPTRRAMILHRLGLARSSAEFPALAELAGRLRDALADRWGAEPLGYAPAFVQHR
ncbi:phosphotransferase [Krasilnikovia sp. MM14-A1004]|uniref:phosphotransferase n=1 Tax=Krasilnikovia sp. MM14-A1004 TaxID=3373541 RepID=UPI00399C69D5